MGLKALSVILAATAFTTVAASAATYTATFDFTLSTTGVSPSLTYTDPVTGLEMKVTSTGGNGVVQTWAGHGLGAPTDSHHLVDSYGVPETVNFAFSIGGVAQEVLFSAVSFTAAYINAWDDFELFADGVSQGVADVPAGGTATYAPPVGPADNFGVGAVGSETFWSTTDYFSNSYNACKKDDWRKVESGGHWEKVKEKVKSRWGWTWVWKDVWVKDYVKEYQQTCYSAFKIAALTVTWADPPPPPVVPLPAAGLLLAGGLGALGLLRRRKA